MSWYRLSNIAGGFIAVGLALGTGVAVAQQAGYPASYNFGTPASDADIAAWNIAYPPSGAGLPAGSGTYDQGKQLFSENCAACHGNDLKGISDPNLPQNGGPALIGGRGTLNTDKPDKTVESYWPYATTLYDYIHRAMPYTSPDSLKPDEVYALVAYILGEANIIDKTETMNAQTLPKVQMPNRDGFFVDNRPMPVLPYSAPLLGPHVPTQF
jgi:mono/diheme cytochrome c family protein